MLCTLCKKPIVMHVEARYTIADSDDGEYGEHYKCHEEFVAKLKTDGDRLVGKIPEIKATLDQIKKFFVLGWLLVSSYGHPISWYPDESTCKKAGPYYTSFSTICVPDRFEFEEGGSLFDPSKKREPQL